MKKRLHKVLGTLMANKRGVYKKFADTYDLVYFGTIGAQDDEHKMVRGVTVSTKHIDHHYCVGTVHGYDTVLLERTDSLSEPGSTRKESYKWIIMQFDLHASYNHPHTFLDGGHHDAVFYKQISLKFAQLSSVGFHYLTNADPAFDGRFSVYTGPTHIMAAAQILSQEVSSVLAAHFSYLDFEWEGSDLFVYCNDKAPSQELLEHMLRAGLWLSRELDALSMRLQQLQSEHVTHTTRTAQSVQPPDRTPYHGQSSY